MKYNRSGGLYSDQRQPGDLAVEEDQRERGQVECARPALLGRALRDTHGDQEPAEAVEKPDRIHILSFMTADRRLEWQEKVAEEWAKVSA